MNRSVRGQMTLLSVLSALMMSLPWLVPHLGFLALVGLVPLLCAERIAQAAGVRRFWPWHYLTFVLWNAATTFWVCNATVGGGVFAILANALQMSLVFGLFRLSRKFFSATLSYLFLAALWIAWEHVYFDVQVSWPWLVLGNAFAQSTRAVQWYSVTGALGGSLWIWAVNLSLFGLLSGLPGRRLARGAALAGTVLLVAGPSLVSEGMYRSFDTSRGTPVSVLIAQPDFDPYQKFESLTQGEQTEILLSQYAQRLEADTARRCLLLAPETFTGDVFLHSRNGGPDLVSGPTLDRFRQFLQRYPNCDLLFGASSYKIYPKGPAPSPLARRYGDGWIEAHNSALMTGAGGRTEVFHKSKLVVGVESTPWPALFTRIDDLLGGVMGRNIGQDEVSCLHLDRSSASGPVPLGCAVCYESVYGAYCTQYVRRGARLMTVITNDAWWGDTPGYRQHLSYARLRAIELRRDLARCANTGISALIDARGDVLARTPWWQRTTLEGSLRLRDGQTLFVRYGDVTGRICLLMAVLLCLALLRECIQDRRK